MIKNEESKEMLCDFTQFQAPTCIVSKYYWQFTNEDTLEAAYQNYWIVSVESTAELNYYWECNYEENYNDLQEPITEEQLIELGFIKLK